METQVATKPETKDSELLQVSEVTITESGERFLEREHLLKMAALNEELLKSAKGYINSLQELNKSLEEFSAMQKLELDRLRAENIECALVKQTVADHARKQSKTIEEQETTITTFVEMLGKMCDDVEARYDNDENMPSKVFSSPEFAQDYIDSAKLLEGFDRKFNRVNEAKRWLDNN